MTKRHLLSIVSLIFLLSVQGAFGASITITPSGNGSFGIQGNSMAGVNGIELNVVYDNSSLGSPSVSQGSLITGAMMASNTNIPGSIKIDIISSTAFSGSGQIATISFASHAGTGSISVSTTLIDIKGAPVPGGGTSAAADFQTSASDGFNSTPGIPFSKPGSTDTNTTTATTNTTSVVGGSVPTALGTVSMPSDVQTSGNTKSAETVGLPEKITEPSAVKQREPDPAAENPAKEPKPPVKVTTIAYQGTLENFRAFKGEKTPAILIELLKKEIAPTIRQEPALVLSDGKAAVKLLVKFETTDGRSPKFILDGAELMALSKSDTSGTWIIEALPNAGALQATLTILTDRVTIEYPFTLAPPVVGISPDTADFAVFLKDSGAAKPKRDLNGDGRHDYLDDFIYTVNHLVVRESAGKAKK